MKQKHLDKIKGIATELYGPARAQKFLTALKDLLRTHQSFSTPGNPIRKELDETDIALICYGDNFRSTDISHLQSLKTFLDEHLAGLISLVHLLPFYPYSSDDGFAVIDYKKVNPDFGDWTDIEDIHQNFELIFDAVVNHISAKSPWLQEYLNGNPDYSDFFIDTDPAIDLSEVARARVHSLLTRFEKAGKPVYLWTTFSDDQVDLNYQNPRVLLEIIDVLLFYASQGARIIRLDAIGHIWKRIGTSCLSLKETHQIVQLFHLVMEIAYPDVLLLSETNVPFRENLSYFGNGQNEVQMVYQFALPGLVLYCLYQANATVLMNWLRTIPLAPGKCLYLNVLATHDGIGVRPLEGILSDTEIATIADNIAQTGGYTSSKKTAGGSLSPYELNSTYYSALATFQDESLNIKKYLASQAILLSLAGLPAIYIHSLFGTENDFDGVRDTGQKRSINRRKFDLSEIREILSNSENRMTKIFFAYQKMIKIRRQQRAFHPKGPQKVIPITSEVFSILRSSPDNLESIFVLINMTPEILPVTLPENIFESKNKICNLLTDSLFQIREEIELSPYEVLWLKEQK